MAQAAAHFAIGMAGTTLVITPWNLRYPHLVTVLGGLWAMLPDIYWVVPAVRPWSPAYHHHPLANICWLHHLIDTRLDPYDTDVFVAGALALLVAVTMFSEYWVNVGSQPRAANE